MVAAAGRKVTTSAEAAALLGLPRAMESVPRNDCGFEIGCGTIDKRELVNELRIW
ncbi:hypothetical protein MAV_2522 [Mycobacterium avium 104]|uniref:Uncharacterized protein n=1 Tax=Mycobacterium avium (strain 104) TaxID=243243 RepID=A0A0H2ZYB8_MYCA1|nr:hypothetical protein MAV_2522 [Mycobacterium avium 104]